jgi:hypothetical protein
MGASSGRMRAETAAKGLLRVTDFIVDPARVE